MNEQTNVLNVLLAGLSQVQSMKDKLDPEVFELLNKSAHEAIASAHTFLDACEKALDSLVGDEEATTTPEDADLADIVNLSHKHN